MYQCNDCKLFFDTPTATDREPDTGAYDVLCPRCGSDYISDAKFCSCGKAPTTEDFCEDCYEQVRLTINKLKDDLGFEQNDFEQIIANHFGW